MAGWLHGVFVGEWLFVFPLCGFSLSLFCNYIYILASATTAVNTSRDNSHTVSLRQLRQTLQIEAKVTKTAALSCAADRHQQADALLRFARQTQEQRVTVWHVRCVSVRVRAARAHLELSVTMVRLSPCVHVCCHHGLVHKGD